MIKANLLFVEDVIARAAHQLDLARGERRVGRAGLASDEQRAHIGRKQLEQTLARLLIDALESVHRRRTPLKIVLKDVMTRRKVAEKAPRRHSNKRKLLPFADDGGDHHDREKNLHKHNALPHQVGAKESVNE